MTLQAKFGDDSLAEFGMRGMWEDVRASIAQLVAAGPPAEEVVHPQDEGVDEIVEVLLPAQEEVSTPVALKWKLTSVVRSLVTCAGQKGSPAL